MVVASSVAERANRVVALLTVRNETIAVAESMTGGLVSGALTSVPGSSACVRGGVVSYATELKATLLGVNSELLDNAGAVDERVALAMAQGVSRACSSDIGLAITGVAGPAEQDGVAVGTVFIAVWASREQVQRVVKLDLPGNRAEIREQAVSAALALVIEEFAADETR